MVYVTVLKLTRGDVGVVDRDVLAGGVKVNPDLLGVTV